MKRWFIFSKILNFIFVNYKLQIIVKIRKRNLDEMDHFILFLSKKLFYVNLEYRIFYINICNNLHKREWMIYKNRMQ